MKDRFTEKSVHASCVLLAVFGLTCVLLSARAEARPILIKPPIDTFEAKMETMVIDGVTLTRITLGRQVRYLLGEPLQQPPGSPSQTIPSGDPAADDSQSVLPEPATGALLVAALGLLAAGTRRRR